MIGKTPKVLMRCALIAFFGIVLPAMPAAAQRPYRIAPSPDWAEEPPFETDCRFSEQTISNGVCYLLVDIQKDLTKSPFSHRYRYVKKILNGTGAEEYAQINISFSPEYETVTLNHVRILRDQKPLNRLQKKNISVLRRETRMDSLMYDGKETVHIIIEDVRPGDVLDYAYTVKGSNPVLRPHFFDEIVVQWDVPIQKMLYRLRFPAGREVRYKAFKTDLAPTVTRVGETDEYRIARTDIPAVDIEENTPEWYDPYPRVQFSDMLSWQHVAEWGARLYSKNVRIAAPLREKIKQIASNNESAFERYTAALRFVQAEVRYLGMEIGEGSFKPRNPSLVFERRFGDCKDKSYLLVTMLRALHIEAVPALVNTTARGTVENMLPSPSVFNHVIVFATVEGTERWMDPAQSPQRARFNGLYSPDYGAALLLRDTETALTKMPPRTLSSPTKVIEETLDLSGPVDRPVPFSIKTTLIDEEAQVLDANLERNGYESVRENYLKYYADDYPDIREKKKPVIEKIPHENRTVITESYEIPNFWQRDDATGEYRGSAAPKELSAYIYLGTPKHRDAPLALTHPVNVSQTARITLPEDIVIPSVDETKEDAGFFFRHIVSRRENVYTVKYRYFSKTDHVSSADAFDHLSLRSQIAETLGYTFHRSTTEALTFSEKVQSHLPIVLLLCILLITATIGAVLTVRKVYRYDPKHPPKAGTEKQPIRGWLALFSLSVIIAPFLSLYWIYGLRESFYFDTIDYFTHHTSEGYNALWLPIVLFESVFNLFFFAGTLLLLVLLFKRRQSFPRVFLAVQLSRIVFHIADVVVVEKLLGLPADQSDSSNLMKMVVYTGLWSIYLFRSETAQAFFIRRYTPAETTGPAPSAEKDAQTPTPTDTKMRTDAAEELPPNENTESETETSLSANSASGNAQDSER